LAEQLLAAIRAGSHPSVACEAVGIGKRTLARWMSRGLTGKKGDEQFAELRAKIERARGEAEARSVAQIARAAADDWRAAAWLLERGFPDRWGRPAERERIIEVPAEAPAASEEADPFAEVDELAARRSKHGRTQ